MDKIIVKIKLIFITILLIFSAACSTFEDNDYDGPIEKWTDGQLLEKSRSSFTNKDYDDSYDYLTQLSKRNNKEGLYALGYLYYYGLGVEKDEVKAHDLIRRSAALGYRPAIKALRLFLATKIAFVDNPKIASGIAVKNDKKSKSINKTQNTSATEETSDNDTADTAASDVTNQTSIAKTLNSQDPTNLHSEASIAETELETNDSVDLVTNVVKQPTSVVPNVKTKDKETIALQSTDYNHTTTKQNKLSLSELHEIIKSEVNNKSAETDKLAKIDAPAEIKDQAPSTTVTITHVDEFSSPSIISQFNKLNNKANDDKTPHLLSKSNESHKQKNAYKESEAINQETPKISSIAKHDNIKIQAQDKPTKNIQWLTSQDPNHFTIQITASKNQDEIKKFILANKLQNKAKIFAYQNNNVTWYGVGLGVYDKPSAAYEALLNEIPANIKSNKPWVRQFKNIKTVG